jgi:regulator of sigma E protease
VDLINLFPSFGGAVWTVLAFVVALSIIVFVHEFGHYIVGRWSGIHAEVFSLGFGPVVWSRVDRRGTRWQLAALPLGGFVKFLGDANAASAKDGEAIAKLSAEELRHTMHGAPLWARAATVAAGPLFNFALSILVFAGVIWTTGVATERAVVGSVKELPFAAENLLPGDMILSLNGQGTPDLTTFLKAAKELKPAPSATYEIERSGRKISLDGPFPFPPVVSSVQPGTAAIDAGVQAGDIIASVDGTAVNSFGEMRDLVGGSEGKPMRLALWRDGKSLDVLLTPKRMDIPLDEGGFETRWLLGLSGGLFFTPESRTPGPVEALKLGVKETFGVIGTSLSALSHIVTGAISTCNLRGPLGIAETSGAAASQGAMTFITFIAMLSTAVGLLNLFPIPVLDGGHLVFHAYEAVMRRPPTERALRGLMLGGLSLLLTLMVFALSNDLFCP